MRSQSDCCRKRMWNPLAGLFFLMILLIGSQSWATCHSTCYGIDLVSNQCTTDGKSIWEYKASVGENESQACFPLDKFTLHVVDCSDIDSVKTAAGANVTNSCSNGILTIDPSDIPDNSHANFKVTMKSCRCPGDGDWRSLSGPNDSCQFTGNVDVPTQCTGEVCGQQPVNVCLMLDRTGSVSSTNLANERTAAKGLIDQIAALNNGTRVAIGRFGDNTNGGLEAEIVQALTTNYNQAKTSIDNNLANNSSVGTNVADAISVCQKQLVDNSNGKQNVIVLLSDFDPSEPTQLNNPNFPDQSALTAATTAKNTGTRIFSIGFDDSDASSADETNRALGASIASGNALDDHCTSGHCNSTDISAENADGDDWFISPTGADLTAVFNLIFQVIQCQDDGNACTQESCDPNTNHCESNTVPNCIPCQNAGQCDDHNVCTSDTCIEGRCQYTNNDVSCSDGDGCSENDTCSGGKCLPGTPKVCNDNRSCSTDRCVSPGGTCDFNLSGCQCNSNEDCNDHNSCTDDTCNIDTGVCSNTPNDQNSCSDNSACTSGDHCSGGTCVGSPITCNDNNPCTDDSCDPASGCKFTNDNENSCTDDDECTVGDKCVDGSCVPGDPKVCDDGRSCSTDQCIHPTGQCDFNLGGCECNSNEDCNDNNPCTDDSCNLDTGICSNIPNDQNSCSDNNACTSGDHCSGGSCIGNTITCDDSNPCTDDSCDPGTGCKFLNNDDRSCTDDDECTVGDHCSSGTCVPGSPKVCDDGRSCSTDQCLHPSGQCDFNLGGCQCNSNEDCNDNNPCTDDSCNLDSGTCSNTPNDANTCSDSNACTSGDHCSAGDCVGSPVTCDDSNPCTDDSCNPAEGCEFIPDDENTCTDNDECTVGDQCIDGSCVPGDPKVCNDGRSCSSDQCVSPGGQCQFNLSECSCSVNTDCNDDNPCTDDVCDTNTGKCTNPNNQDSCDDGDLCTTDDVCSDGICKGSPLVGGLCSPPPPPELPTCGNGVCDAGEDCNCIDCAQTNECVIQAQRLKCVQNLTTQGIDPQKANELAAQGICEALLEGESTIGGCSLNKETTSGNWMGTALLCLAIPFFLIPRRLKRR